MPISTERKRRANAGSRMARLLNEEEEDEFYSNVYGGFKEEDEDEDYMSESSVEDVIDSDFLDPSESEEDSAAAAAAEVEEEEGGRKKRKGNRVVTRGYKEPKRAKTTKSQAKNSAKKKTGEKVSTEPQDKPTPPVKDKPKPTVTKKSSQTHVFVKPTLRSRTKEATAKQETQATRRPVIRKGITPIRRKAFLAEIARRKNLPEVRRLTQEELLAEAKITEEINRRSLERFQRLEIERKKARVLKTVHCTPMIRYHSVSVPSIEDQYNIYAVALDADGTPVRAAPIITHPEARVYRNFITFANDECFRRSMPATTTPLPEPGYSAPCPVRPKRYPRICPITGLPARYVDPLTLTPYANLDAFRIIRHLYDIHLETDIPPMELLREYLSSC
ncbi:unnamed protein product [Trichobilharzia regenti]|uniref:Vacuolar protein sorting-associated protein 72 homolog n=1 Tax=Trichobilharzia regenti TaxID=157069 RepID=A0A183VQX4_TRIRE|nr:unnamed protein product [Trichobilharzia regenti]VDP98759.1 unnamed protein product [Trichobilharzia regenti]